MFNPDPKAKVSNLSVFAAGACAGVIASSICYPLDLINARLCVQTSVREYNGIFHAFKSIVSKEGVVGLYRGIGATLIV